MMIVLKQFPHHQKIERNRILTMIIIVIIGITIFVSAPVDSRSMYGAHEKMDRQQQEHPPMRSKNYIEGCIKQSEPDPGHPEVADPVQYRPGRIIAAKSGLGF